MNPPWPPILNKAKNIEWNLIIIDNSNYEGTLVRSGKTILSCRFQLPISSILFKSMSGGSKLIIPSSVRNGSKLLSIIKIFLIRINMNLPSKYIAILITNNFHLFISLYNQSLLWPPFSLYPLHITSMH